MSDDPRLKPGILPAGTTVPLPGAIVEPPPSLPIALDGAGLPVLPARRRGFRWGIALAVSAALLVTGIAAIDAVTWLDALFTRSVALGLAGAALVGGVFAALAGFVGSEVRNLRRLRSAQAIHERGHVLAERSGSLDGHGFIAEVVQLTSAAPAGRALCEQFRDALSDTHDDREVLQLFERIVLRPLDDLAYGAIRRGARDTAIGTSVSPVGGLDAVIVLWRSLRMVREIAEVYGLRPTRFSLFALVRRMFVTATFSVTADMAGDVVGAHLGGRLAGIVSGKLAEGVYAGVRTARLGLLAVDQCRPLPFRDDSRPNLRQLVGQSLGSLLPAGSPPRDPA